MRCYEEFNTRDLWIGHFDFCEVAHENPTSTQMGIACCALGAMKNSILVTCEYIFPIS